MSDNDVFDNEMALALTIGLDGYDGSLLASHGWLVLTLSHTYESIVSEWPTGPIAQNAGYGDQQWAKNLSARVDDMMYMLDRLPELPYGIGAAADVSRIGLVGHSYGGTTSAQCAYAVGDRVKAVVLLDGPIGYPGSSNTAQDNGLEQPVLLLSGTIDLDDGIITGAETVGFKRFSEVTRGPLLGYQVAGARHYAFTDIGMLTSRGPELNGTIDPARGVHIHITWTRAFLNTYVRGLTAPLVFPPWLTWPEVSSIPQHAYPN
ncbi:alpha/beta fold hydrolase [Nocardia colli]|uniref:Alpha/beta fold hydrolase n=1 Tax=Nocardia colli TaxID=2545717 RepID=A0A5N0E9W8_9NOCA|nr:alpha/beta fold hydrolase [Nocardia colli]KAA8886228.1 alpha/beta fold hydrolase [Nocardia colli]